MANIQGLYTLRAPLYNSNDPANRVLYTFTNNDRNASIGFAYQCPLDFAQIDAQNPDNLGDPRKFIVQNKLFIKRARVLTPGAPGLAPGLGGRAAVFYLDTRSSKNGIDTSGDSLILKFDNFNEWQDFNIPFLNDKIDSDTGKYTFLIGAGDGRTALYLDDYNLQNEYVGQDLFAFLELVVDTAGLYNGFNSVV